MVSSLAELEATAEAMVRCTDAQTCYLLFSDPSLFVSSTTLKLSSAQTEKKVLHIVSGVTETTAAGDAHGYCR